MCCLFLLVGRPAVALPPVAHDEEMYEPSPPPVRAPPPRVQAAPRAAAPAAAAPPPPPIVLQYVHVKQDERPKFVVGRAILDRVANAYDPTALSFKEGDKIQIHQQHENGLWVGEIVSESQEVGFVS
jgi:hypothetical protein